jgi:hypothetical protein
LMAVSAYPRVLRLAALMKCPRGKQSECLLSVSYRYLQLLVRTLYRISCVHSKLHYFSPLYIRLYMSAPLDTTTLINTVLF